MQNDVEILVLDMVGIGLTLVILLAIADTAAYPLALGIELVIILYYLIGDANNPAPISVTNLVATGLKFIGNPSKTVGLVPA